MEEDKKEEEIQQAGEPAKEPDEKPAAELAPAPEEKPAAESEPEPVAESTVEPAPAPASEKKLEPAPAEKAAAEQVTAPATEEKRRPIPETIVTVCMLGYGMHYLGYFLRARLFAWMETQPIDDALAHALMYCGHAIFLIILIVYAILVKNDRKYIFCFVHGKPGRNILYGMAGLVLGFVMMGACILAAALHGDLVIRPTFNISIQVFLIAIGAVLLQATTEEIESRGFVFGKMYSEGVPLLIAVGMSSLYFAYLHMANPGFGPIPIASLVLVGILYSLSYYYFGTIWFTATAHMMWNFTQDFLFGLPDSGKPAVASVFTAEATEASSDFFFDKTFGIEGSIMALIVNGLAIVFVIIFGTILKMREKKEKDD